MALQFPVSPMRAVAGDMPEDDGEWAFEVKWDGMRIVVFIVDGAVRLQSANGLDATARFPELGLLADSLVGEQVVIDGEVIALDDDGRPSFESMQERMHLVDTAEIRRRMSDRPITLQAFDLLSYGGTDATGLSYVDRRRLLSQVLEPSPHWMIPPHRVGDGPDLLAAVAQRDMEGVMAKRLESTYEVGQRSPAWRKIKVRHRQDLLVCGWQEGQGGRSGRIGSLLLAHPDETGLRFAGSVGTGFTEAELSRLARLLEPLERSSSPLVDEVDVAAAKIVHWVTPRLIVDVEFGEWTSKGHLRHPSYRGQRVDVDPDDVRRE